MQYFSFSFIKIVIRYCHIIYFMELCIMKDELIKGHAAAFFTAILWGTTFISTKVLLRDFAPVEILFIRFLMGLLALFIVCPKRFKSRSVREEAAFALAGLTGICLYYLLENIALTFTMASNVSVVVAVAPFFPEYRPFVEENGGHLVVVPADREHFQIDLVLLGSLLVLQLIHGLVGGLHCQLALEQEVLGVACGYLHNLTLLAGSLYIGLQYYLHISLS